MKWLIFEDALRDRKGHWFEHIKTLRKGLLDVGDEVRVFCANDAEQGIRESLDAHPILPKSIWHRMGDAAGPLARLWRIPAHALSTYSRVGKFFDAEARRHDVLHFSDREIIFVPTVLPHHLAGWLPLVRCLTASGERRLLFYFLSAPLTRGPDGRFVFEKAPSAVLLKKMLRALDPFVSRKKVLLAAETLALADAMSEAGGVPVSYLPQPVARPRHSKPPVTRESGKLLFASYGAARWEKGSDLLQKAIIRESQTWMDRGVRFAIQWIDDFRDASGRIVHKDASLMTSERVSYIQDYFQGGEYEAWMDRTDAVVLPYRKSSYGLRGSRVLLEAMVSGIPCITVEDSAPAWDLKQKGSGLLIRDGDVDSLVDAMKRMAWQNHFFRREAIDKMDEASKFYSALNFKNMVMENLTGTFVKDRIR